MEIHSRHLTATSEKGSISGRRYVHSAMSVYMYYCSGDLVTTHIAIPASPPSPSPRVYVCVCVYV